PPSASRFPYTPLFRSSSDRRIRYTSPWRVSEIRFADWCLETDCLADTYRARRLRGRVQVRPPRQQLPLPGHLDAGHDADAHQQRSEEHTSELQSRFDL